MVKRPLPTGEEPPKGYETLSFAKVEEGLWVDFVMLNHLARSERSQIEALRNKSLMQVLDYIGLSNEPLSSIEREAEIINEIPGSDKLIARAWQGKQLVGYALVVIGWPERCQWLIQHLIVDPEESNQGIGTTIVSGIEQLALESEVAADSIFAVPIQNSGRTFWQNRGYTVEASRFLVRVANVDHEIVVYHKEL